MTTQPKYFVYYHYYPSLAAAIVAIVLFALTTIAHTFQLVKTRTWYLIPFVVGGIFEAVGYIGRAESAKEAPDFTKNPYIIQSLLTLLAPALFAASIYMILGRIVTLTQGQTRCPVSTRWLTPLFVTGDVISFLVQGAGGGIMAGGGLDKLTTGEHIIIVGLFIQVAFFAAFIITAGIFHWRMVKRPTNISLATSAPWKQYLFVLYAASLLILARNIVRIVEYITGDDGAILQHEWYIYVFDALLMFAVMVLFNIMHPSLVVKGRTKNSDEGDVRLQSS